MGELLTEMPKQNGARPPSLGLQTATPNPPPTLADMGIEKTLAHRCQKIASLPEEVFEDYIESAVDGKHELTTAGAIKLAKSEDLRVVKESHVNLAKTATGAASVCAWDALPFLQSLPDSFADLLLTDPPYMTDVQDITGFAHEWLPVALTKVKRTGRAYVCIGAYPDELLAYLSARALSRRRSSAFWWSALTAEGVTPRALARLDSVSPSWYIPRRASCQRRGRPDTSASNPASASRAAPGRAWGLSASVSNSAKSSPTGASSETPKPCPASRSRVSPRRT